MLESIIALLYVSGMAITATAIYGTVDHAVLPRALAAIVLWPFILPVMLVVMLWGYVVDRFR